MRQVLRRDKTPPSYRFSFLQVTKGKKWSDLGRILGYRGIPGLSTQIRNSYTRVILPYEHFCDRARNLPGASPVTRDPHLKTHRNIQSPEMPSRLSATVTTPVGGTSPPSSPLTATSSLLSEPPDESDHKEGSRSASARPRRSARMGSQDSGVWTHAYKKPTHPLSCSIAEEISQRGSITTSHHSSADLL
jgi:hypothetical protein